MVDATLYGTTVHGVYVSACCCCCCCWSCRIPIKRDQGFVFFRPACVPTLLVGLFFACRFFNSGSLAMFPMILYAVKRTIYTCRTDIHHPNQQRVFFTVFISKFTSFFRDLFSLCFPTLCDIRKINLFILFFSFVVILPSFVFTLLLFFLAYNDHREPEKEYTFNSQITISR